VFWSYRVDVDNLYVLVVEIHPSSSHLDPFTAAAAYADNYANLLREENIICSLKSTVEVVLKNRANY